MVGSVRKAILPWVLAGALVAFAFTLVDTATVLHALSTIPLSWVVAGLSVCVADRVLMALRWHLLIRGLGGNADFANVLVVHLKSSLFGLLFHALCGDFAKVAYLKNNLDVNSIIIPSLLIDRAIGLIAASLLATCGLVYLAERANVPFLRELLSITIVTLIFIGASYLTAGRFKRLINRITAPAAGLISRWADAMTRLAGRSDVIVVNLTIALVRQCLMVSILFAYAAYFSENVEVFPLLSIMGVQFLMMRLPISPDGWGVGELTAVSLYEMASVQAEAALTAMLLFRSISWITCVPGVILIVLSAVRPAGERRRDRPAFPR